MISGIVKAVVLLLLVSSVSSTCSCSRSPLLGLSVNCSSQDLYHIPDFPSNTTELYLQHNRLATVPPGFFDKFPELRVVDLSENPFHCSCDVQYLRAWLLRNRDLTAGSPPTCSSPVSRAHRAIISLEETEFSSCMKRSCSGTVSNLVLVFLLCGVLGLLVWSLCLAKGLGVTLGIGEKHGSFQAASLRSLKPKHREKVKYLSQWSEVLERPLLNMDILPQIIDTLHKHHNINIKDS